MMWVITLASCSLLLYSRPWGRWECRHRVLNITYLLVFDLGSLLQEYCVIANLIQTNIYIPHTL